MTGATTVTPFVLLLLPVLSASMSADRPPANAVVCPISEYIDESDELVTEYFQCPGPEDPKDYTICCNEKCCPLLQIDSVLKVDIRIAMVISLTVICICVLSGIIIVVCCFASSCPLYDTCSGSWGKNEASYVPADLHPLTLNGMPTSETDELKNHLYKVQDGSNIKITKPDHV